MPEDEQDKPVEWIASSRKDLRAFPHDARSDAGYNLRRVQQGKTPRNFNSLSHLGSGVMEIKVDDDGDTYRVVYVAKFEEAVYVLDAFQKKSPRGKKLPKNIRERIKSRYKMMEARRAELIAERGE